MSQKIDTLKKIAYAHGGIIGLLTVSVSVLCDFLAFMLFPGYNMTTHMISQDLGIGPGAAFFNVGMVIVAIFSIIFFLCVDKSLVYEIDVNQDLRKITINLAIISCFCMAMVGIFPSDFSSPRILLLHVIFALASFISGTILFFLVGILLYQSKKYSKLQAINAFAVSVLFLFFLFQLTPLTEWLGMIGLLAFQLNMGLYMLYKKI